MVLRLLMDQGIKAEDGVQLPRRDRLRFGEMTHEPLLEAVPVLRHAVV